MSMSREQSGCSTSRPTSASSVSRSSSISRSSQFALTPQDGDSSAPGSRNSSRPPSAWNSPITSPSVEHQGTWPYSCVHGRLHTPQAAVDAASSCRSSANSSRSSVSSNATGASQATLNRHPSFGLSAGNTSAFVRVQLSPRVDKLMRRLGTQLRSQTTRRQRLWWRWLGCRRAGRAT